MAEPKVDPKSTIELHVIITEDASKTLDVRYTALIAGTEQKAHLRPTHLAGLLTAAATFVIINEMPELKAMTAAIEEKPNKHKKG